VPRTKPVHSYWARAIDSSSPTSKVTKLQTCVDSESAFKSSVDIDSCAIVLSNKTSRGEIRARLVDEPKETGFIVCYMPITRRRRHVPPLGNFAISPKFASVSLTPESAES
jgi:hypothetical protein